MASDKQADFDEITWINDYYHNSQVDPILVTDIEKVLRFSLMWNLFESEICNMLFQDCKIKDIINALITKDILNLKEFEDCIEYFRARYKDENKLQALAFRPDKKAQEMKSVVEQFITNTEKKASDIEAIIYIIYRLRNNMFHGLKPLPELKYQEGNFASANKFLAQFLDLHKKLNE